jgi:dynein heavy chain
MMNLIFEGIDGEEMGPILKFALPRTNLNVIQQLTRMLDSILNEDDPI